MSPTTIIYFTDTNMPNFCCTNFFSEVDAGASHNFNTVDNLPKRSRSQEHQPMQVVLPNSQIISSH